MAAIHTLKIQGVRNIARLHLSGLSRVNHFYGANGAGKTSVLEALHLLGLGRSFRSSRQLPIISHQEDAAIVYGEIAVTPGFSAASGEAIRESVLTVGVQRNRNGTSEFRINGRRAESAAQLADNLPLQVINADTFDLLLGSPGIRRQFIDWGVFHVEHSFLDLWRRMQRTLKQRNSLLRRGKIHLSELNPWDQEFCQLAESVSDQREAYFHQWLPVLFDLLDKVWENNPRPEISFFSGWDRRLSAQEMLERQLRRDQHMGFTTMGPHRADLRVRVQGLPVGEVLSRGQLKLLSVAMRISQGSLLGRHGAKQCTFLVDDLPAELDSRRRSAVRDLLVEESNSQIFFTSVDKDSLDFTGMDPGTLSVFHVEHGVVHQ